MVTEEDVRQARAQAEEVGAAMLLLLLLRDYGRDVAFSTERGVFLVDGKRVGVTQLRRLLAKVEQVGVRRLRRHTSDLLAKRITLAQWRARMQADVAASHLLTASLALGSLEAARRSPEVAEKVAEEKDYVVGFAADLRAGKVSEPRALARAASYLLAAIVTYCVLEQATQGGAGKTEAKRIRRASESCPGCRLYAGRWLPIAVMPPIGSLDCGSHCRCYLIYR